MNHSEVKILICFGLVILAGALRIWMFIMEDRREERRQEFLRKHGRFPSERELHAEK